MASPEKLHTSLERQGLQVRRLRKPRIREMHDIEVLDSNGSHIAYIRLFTGRPPHYRGWIEIYAINPSHKTAVELLVKAAAEALEPGETLYIEYLWDKETTRQLERATPPEDTPLGRLLAATGLTSIADMYYPEGFMEGGPKLRATKKQ